MDNYLLAILIVLCIYIVFMQYSNGSSGFSVPAYLTGDRYARNKHETTNQLRITEKNRISTLEPELLSKTIKHEQTFSNPDDLSSEYSTFANYDYNNMVEKIAVDEDVSSNHKKYVKEANAYQGARVFGEIDMAQQVSWIGLRRPEGVYQSKDALFITEIDQETLGKDRPRYLI